MKTPNFFIVGAPKCGTTSLYQWLRQHPDVFMPEKKEPKWFCHDLREASKENGSEHLFPVWNEDEYRDLFADTQDEKAVGEASTYYLYSQTAPEAIKAFNPKAKIIIMLRDPVEQIISSYNFSVQKGHETAGSLQDALELETKRKESPPAGKMPKSYLYSEKAQFTNHIKRWQKYFDDSQIKIILLDDMKDRPEEIYQDTLNFLGVEETDFTPEFSQENTGGSPRFRWLNKAIKHPSSPIRKVAELIPKSLAKQIRDTLNAVLLTKNKQGVSESTRKKLKKTFQPEVTKLSKLLDRDLRALWSYTNNQ